MDKMSFSELGICVGKLIANFNTISYINLLQNTHFQMKKLNGGYRANEAKIEIILLKISDSFAFRMRLCIANVHFFSILSSNFQAFLIV